MTRDYHFAEWDVADANIMAAAWAHRMQYMFYKHGGRHDLAAGFETGAGDYEEPANFTELVARVGHLPHKRRRIDQIRNLVVPV